MQAAREINRNSPTISSLGATLAIADVVDTKVQDLYKQGYTYFEFARGTVKSQIEAYAPNGTKMIFFR